MRDTHVEIESIPVVEVPTRSLLLGFSPRLAGPSEENVHRLAELDRPLPPVLVLRSTNQVIDGTHRLLAAQRRGQQMIAVRYYDGDEDSAFVLAVSANVTHGLPLSLNDRRAAAARILGRHAEWSNRRIAVVTGLSDKTVGAIRARSGPVGAQSAVARIGLDGRSRPVEAASWSHRATGQLADEPPVSLRQIANVAEASPGTVRETEADSNRGAGRSGGRREAASRTVGLDLQQWLDILVKDPALRSTDAGRLLLRTLSTVPVIERNIDKLIECLPEHDLALFQRLALANADVWRRLADSATSRRKQNVERATPAAAA
jgi:ParB-like chromosome segregation protein Spo0J